MAKKETKAVAKKAPPARVAKREKPTVDVVVFDGLKKNQRFNVGSVGFEPGEVHRCEVKDQKPVDEALAAAVEANVASMKKIPDPDSSEKEG